MAVSSQSSLKVGDTAYLKIDTFTPGWRQGLVVRRVNRKGSFLLACRVLEAEIRRAEVSTFKAEGALFMLVEGKMDQLRVQCSSPHRALEADIAPLMTAAEALLGEDNLQYMTASEELPEPEMQKPRKATVTGETSEESSESDSGDDPVMKMLLQAQKTGRGKGSNSESGAKPAVEKKQRYPMLNAKKEVVETSGVGIERILAQSLAAGSQDQVANNSLNALVSLELLRTLKGKNKVSSSRNLNLSQDDSEDSSSGSSSGHRSGKPRGVGKALRDFRQGHRQMRKRPLRHVRRYIREVEEVLGANSEVAYNLSDFTKRLQWGKQKTLMRVHFALSELLQTLLKGKSEQAALQCVQLLRATYQSCLDNGGWKAAGLLLQHADPLERPRFGGEANQLEQVASYLKALQELEKKNVTTDRLEEDPSERKGVKGQKKGKGKKGEEAPET